MVRRPVRAYPTTLLFAISWDAGEHPHGRFEVPDRSERMALEQSVKQSKDTG